MRIGTWNLDANWSDGHRAVLSDLDCDVLLLTEVPEHTRIVGYEHHLGRTTCSPHVRWSSVMSRQPLRSLPDPHAASAAVLIEGTSFCSSVLPWPLSGELDAFPGTRHQERFGAVVATIIDSFAGSAGVWGGDWNQPLSGRMSGFSHSGRQTLLDAAAEAGLQLPLAGLPGRMTGQGTIDQIAVPLSWSVALSARVSVPPAVSDHDAYWVEIAAL